MAMFGLALIGLMAASAPASAAVVLDQDALIQPAGLGVQIVTPARRLIAGQLRDFAYVQTATAGLTGTLSNIELQGYRNFTQPADTLRLTLIDGDYVAGARTVVGSLDLNAANAPGFEPVRNLQTLLNFDTSGFAYQVTAGQKFSIKIELIPFNQTGSFNFITANNFGQVQQPDGTFRSVTEGANYNGGGVYQLALNTGAPLALSHDIGFRSFVDVAGAVPEPSTWAMLIVGFGFVGASVRRRATAGALSAA